MLEKRLLIIWGSCSILFFVTLSAHWAFADVFFIVALVLHSATFDLHLRSIRARASLTDHQKQFIARPIFITSFATIAFMVGIIIFVFLRLQYP